VSNKGAGILMIYCVIILAYSFVMIYVFYVIPAKYGLAFGLDMGYDETKLDLSKRDSMRFS
jgi:hypothetical protein